LISPSRLAWKERLRCWVRYSRTRCLTRASIGRFLAHRGIVGLVPAHPGSVRWCAEGKSWWTARHIYRESLSKSWFCRIASERHRTSLPDMYGFYPDKLFSQCRYCWSVVCTSDAETMPKEAVVVVWRHEALFEMKSHHLMRPPRSLSIPVTLSSNPRFFLSSSLISSSSRIISSLVIGATKFSSSTA
jgi:hypothetical protein